MGELWDIYDRNLHKTGKTVHRGDKVGDREYHLVVDIWTIDPSGKILVTQRHPKKKFGTLWECSGGAVIAGENSIQGAIRELSEEVGILLPPEEFEYIGRDIRWNSILDTYKVVTKVELEKLVLQEEEVTGAKLVTVEEFEEMNKNKMIAPPVWKRFLLYRDKILCQR